jgi:hypothetical protein
MMSLQELDMSGNSIGWTLPAGPVSSWLGPNVSTLDLSDTLLVGNMGSECSSIRMTGSMGCLHAAKCACLL